ncbi:MAG: lactate racemase domain-containing protein, partial [Gemmatimonadetes bacterium]|nr:lactate racemase domain-containing protein [Gemmatimonadota bacterium]
MKTKLDYGRDGLEIEVPDSAAVLQMARSEGLDQLEERIDHALARPIGTPSLRRLARGRKNACIVIADITRPVPNAVILPPMLRILEEEGIARG